MLNVQKAYAFVPKAFGPVKLTSRSSTRARLTAGGSYWRSKEYGEQANLIKLTVVEDLTLPTPEGLWVEQHTVFKAEEMVSATGMSVPSHTLFDLNLNWDEEIRIRLVNGELACEKYGIRWQIAGGETLLESYGVVTPKKLFTIPSVLAIKLDVLPTDWPTGAVLYLRPRTHRVPLAALSVTDPETAVVSTGWDIGVLRATLNGLTEAWTKMPARGMAADPQTPGSQATQGEDKQDDGTDATFLTAFDSTPLKGGDGLPAYPVGLNTGPDRVLVHLNYAEKEDGSMGELNQVFEWAGASSRDGSWQRYS